MANDSRYKSNHTMNGQLKLPRPGSVWKQTKLNRPMRVVYSSANEIIVHDAERSDVVETIISWIGTADQFFDLFEPADSSTYP